jgi:antitoxin HicB
VTATYRIELTPDDNDTFLVTCPALPGVVTFGETVEAARHHAIDAIETMIASMMALDQDVPLDDGTDGERVTLPLLTTLKVMLHREVRRAGITQPELARRLGWSRQSVDRLFRLDHKSRVEEIEAAFRALGQVLDVAVRRAA